MKHLDEGALRRLYDDPLGVAEPERAHFAGCAECGAAFDRVADEARASARLLAGASAAAPAAPDADAAWRRLEERTPAAAPGAGRLRRWSGRHRAWRPAAAAGLAAALVAVLAVTGAAQQLFTVMQPSQVALVPVTTSDFQAMPDLTRFGTVTWSDQPVLHQAPDAAAARQVAGFAAPQASLPAGVTGRPSYAVFGSSTATFTFSAARAQAWAAQRGETLPAMPAGLDGSSLTLAVGPAIAVAYGAPAAAGPDGAQMPQLAIVKMRAPVLESTGPSVAEIERYLLSLPGVSPQLAAEIRALGDPASTLPLPIPIDRASSQQVDVNGARGVLVGDNTGLGAGVIWIRGGYVYGVGGTASQDAVLQAARSLS